jgi:hypothetical protein
MKRAKQDAADQLVAGLERVIREYKRTKDAPAVPRTMKLLVDEESGGRWVCRHTPRCNGRGACDIARKLGRPEVA